MGPQAAKNPRVCWFSNRSPRLNCCWTQDVGESMQHERALVRDDGPLHADGEPCGAYLIVFACWVVAEAIEPLSHPLEPT
jgi:hypothetical protein